MKNLVLKALVITAFLFGFSSAAHGQFREEAFSQTYATQSDSTSAKDTVDKMWSFKEFFRGVSHKDSVMRIGTMFAGSTVFIGSEQIYNRQYWKLPIVYGGLGATVGLGVHYRRQYNQSKSAYDIAYAADPNTTLTVDNDAKKMATIMFASAGVVYWGTLMDGIINYDTGGEHSPGKATIYSILLPGLGQVYNGEAWKVPIYWGLMIGSYHYYQVNRNNYLRYKRIHNEATSTEVEYTGRIPAERALYYRNTFRRFRDYSMLCIVASYLLQVIDANVFSYMRDFEVNDDLALKIEPTVISPYNEYAIAPPGSGAAFRSPAMGAGAIGSNAIGLRIGFTF